MRRSRRRRWLAVSAVLVGALFGVSVFVSSAEAAFPGKNGLIAYTQSSTGKLRTTAPNGSGRVSLNLRGRDVAWSPDGRQIAFGRYNNNSASGFAIYVANADGTDVRFVTDGSRPAWSPDGQTIAYRSSAGRFSLIRSIRVDGTGRRKLITNGFDPSWSPDGRLIAFTRRDTAIWIARANGKFLRRLTSKSASAHTPDWSPDGRKLTFSVRRGIAVINANGARFRRIVTDPSSVGSVEPKWSPDGRFIVFHRHLDGGGSALFRVRTNGKGLKRLTPATGFARDPSWQPLPR